MSLSISLQTDERFNQKVQFHKPLHELNHDHPAFSIQSLCSLIENTLPSSPTVQTPTYLMDEHSLG